MNQLLPDSAPASERPAPGIDVPGAPGVGEPLPSPGEADPPGLPPVVDPPDEPGIDEPFPPPDEGDSPTPYPPDRSDVEDDPRRRQEEDAMRYPAHDDPRRVIEPNRHQGGLERDESEGDPPADAGVLDDPELLDVEND
jgi:hypothetical protein